MRLSASLPTSLNILQDYDAFADSSNMSQANAPLTASVLTHPSADSTFIDMFSEELIARIDDEELQNPELLLDYIPLAPTAKRERLMMPSDNKEPLSQFPNEILLLILKHLALSNLCQVRSVCKSWFHLVPACLVRRTMYCRLGGKPKKESLRCNT